MATEFLTQAPAAAQPDDYAGRQSGGSNTGGISNNLGNAAAKVAGKEIAVYFWGTIYLPLVSYGWTAVMLFAGFAAAPGKKLFSKTQKIVMIAFDLFWFFAAVMLITMVAVYICHGGVSALAIRTAARAASLFQLDFGFCENIPDPGI